MKPFQLLPSTTSHKHEPIVPTLAVFARLGFCEIDLNLHHLIEGGVSVDTLRRALERNRQRVPLVSGGWCDFFDRPPRARETFDSVTRQVSMARALGATALRLFFGRLDYGQYSREVHATIVSNIQQTADAHPDMSFILENHDGASACPTVCREILEGVARPNVRLTFDPINFEHRGVGSLEAARELTRLVGHVHLKGYDRGRFCEFGTGDVDLDPVLRLLVVGGYTGAFTVEYEGSGDRTVRLFVSMRNATSALARVLERDRLRPLTGRRAKYRSRSSP